MTEPKNTLESRAYIISRLRLAGYEADRLAHDLLGGEKSRIVAMRSADGRWTISVYVDDPDGRKAGGPSAHYTISELADDARRTIESIDNTREFRARILDESLSEIASTLDVMEVF